MRPHVLFLCLIAWLPIIVCAGCGPKTQPVTTVPEASPSPIVGVARSVAENVHTVIAIAMPLWKAYVHNRVESCRAQNLPTREAGVTCLGPAAHSGAVKRNMEALVAAQEVLVRLLDQSTPNPTEIGAAYITLGERLQPLIGPFRLAGACRLACEKVATAYNL